MVLENKIFIFRSKYETNVKFRADKLPGEHAILEGELDRVGNAFSRNNQYLKIMNTYYLFGYTQFFS